MTDRLATPDEVDARGMEMSTFMNRSTMVELIEGSSLGARA